MRGGWRHAMGEEVGLQAVEEELVGVLATVGRWGGSCVFGGEEDMNLIRVRLRVNDSIYEVIRF